MLPKEKIFNVFKKFQKESNINFLNQYTLAVRKTAVGLYRHEGSCGFFVRNYLYSTNFTLKILKIWNLHADILNTIKELHLFSYRSYMFP